MGAAQMGVQLPAPRAGGPAAAFPQSQAAGGVMAGHGAPGPAAGQAGLMGAAGGMTVDQTIAGMYGGGLPVQPGGPPQHGSGGMVGIPGQPVSGMMGQMAQQHQQHAGVGMAVAGSAAPGAPMGIMPPQQAAAPHPHVHAVSVAPTPSTQMPYGMPPGQQQDMSYAQLNQHQLMAHQAAVAAAAQQQQHAQQQQQQQHAQQQQAAVAAAVQQQAAQVMGRVASGSLPPQGAVAAAAAAAASRKAGPMPMGPAAAVAASQVSRPGAVAGTGMPAGPNLATQQQPPQPQQQQQPQPAVAVPPMGTTANPVYGGAPTVAGLASPAVGMPGVHGAAAPPPSGGPPPIVPGGAMPVAQHTAAGLAATTTAPPVPPVAASAAANNVQSASTPVLPGSSHVVVLQDVTPLLMEDYWKAIAALKTRVHVLRAQLDKYTKVAEQQGPQGKAQRSRRILLEAFKRCTVDPNTPEYSSMPVSATSVKLMLAVLSSLDNSIQMGRRPGAVPATAAAPQQPGPALAVGTESAAGPVASPEAVRPAAATPPIPQAPQPQPQSQPQSQPQPQPLHPAGAGGAVVPAAKPDGVGAVGTAPSPPCVNPPAAASVSANRAAAAAVVAAAAHNAKIRGLKPLGHRPLPGKAGGESAGLHGKMPMDSDYKASLQAALHQGKDAKLERNEDSVSPGVDQVHRLLGLLAQPLPHSTLRVHASRGAADVLNFDWDSLMPSLPATACAQITAAAAAGAASGTSAGPPRARTVSMCRVSGMQYIDGGGSVRTVPTATGSDDTRGALAVKWQRQVRVP
ncbi:hypothetical protein Vretimale_7897 [Volvox reticuliferus]|uniref:Uncharacterized protein n=1 Tax=Volvox reticuliferus TaxID=1737510 RepID=A0A8J4GA88_9CHLO|nr:hypothetical protein Vretimale_7897 [Volvox reticuliferus]